PGVKSAAWAFRQSMTRCWPTTTSPQSLSTSAAQASSIALEDAGRSSPATISVLSRVFVMWSSRAKSECRESRAPGLQPMTRALSTHPTQQLVDARVELVEVRDLASRGEMIDDLRDELG